MTTLAVLIATLLADACIGFAAYKLSKTNTQTNATLLTLLTKSAERSDKHESRLENHEVRIVILERAA
jgi:hypothetical protein